MLNSKKLTKIADLQKLAYQSMFDDVKKIFSCSTKWVTFKLRKKWTLKTQFNALDFA